MLLSADEIHDLARQTRETHEDALGIDKFFAIVRSVLEERCANTEAVEACMDEMTSFLRGNANEKAIPCGCPVLFSCPNWKRWLQMPPSEKFESPFRLLKHIAMQYPECLLHCSPKAEVLDLVSVMTSSTAHWIYGLGVEILTSLLSSLLKVEISEGHQIYTRQRHRCKHSVPQEQQRYLLTEISSRFLTSDALTVLCRRCGKLEKRGDECHVCVLCSLSHGLRHPENRERRGEEAILRFLCLLLHGRHYQDLQPELLALLESMDFVEILTGLSLQSIQLPSATRLQCINQATYEYCMADPQKSKSLLKERLLTAGAQVEARSQIGPAEQEILHFLNLWYYTSADESGFGMEVLVWTRTNNLAQRLMAYLDGFSLDNSPETFCLYWGIVVRAYHSLFRHLHSSNAHQVFRAECSHLFEIGWIKRAVRATEDIAKRAVQSQLPSSSLSQVTNALHAERTLSLLQCEQDVLYFLSLCIHRNPPVAEFCEEQNWMSSLVGMIEEAVPKWTGSPSLEIRVHGARVFLDALSCINELMYHKCTRPLLPCDKAFIRSGLIVRLIDIAGSRERIECINVPNRLALLKKCLHLSLLLKKCTEVTLQSHFPHSVQLVAGRLKKSMQTQLRLLAETKQQVLQSMSSVSVRMLKDLQEAEDLRQISGIDVTDTAS